ncbi:MAG: hypothetical protein MJ147_09460 [Clostridia bacterium]|nr:hypothetical protein [Clostridia bacterium]
MKKIIRSIIAVVLSVICALQVSCQAFAASTKGKTYVKEMVVSYGKTPEEAKAWLAKNGYEAIDCNINEGADDTFSKKRAVYLGYKTTEKAEEAITDMKLMNMNGNYSALDYKIMLEEQKNNIRTFVNKFIVAVSEYRENYKKGQSRAVAAHDMLNILYDNDTETAMGDLLLEKIKEEYTDEDFAKLSTDEQSKHADLTTILMQSNSTSILVIEQLIAIATDDSDSVWTERYNGIKSYDSMIEELIEEESIMPSKAAAMLASKYDKDAMLIASKIPAYLEYLKTYTEAPVSLESTQEEIEAFTKGKDEMKVASWLAVGAQYEMLNALKDEDGTSLLEILTDEDYELDGDDKYLLYPLVSALTEGQRACLDFLPFYQIVSIGINDDSSVKGAMKDIAINDNVEKGSVSIYDGVDRSIFGEEVAMTNAANSLQQSTDKDMTTNWFSDGISLSTKVLYISLGVSVVATIGSFVISRVLHNVAEGAASDKFLANVSKKYGKTVSDYIQGKVAMSKDVLANQNLKRLDDEFRYLVIDPDTSYWSTVFKYVGIGMTVVSFILMGVSAWRTYEDLKAYYNVDFLPIPKFIVDQGVNDKDEKVFTYYTAVACNRQDAKMVTDKTKVLKDFGDINGDVGKQWVALYTTKDKAAGNPVTVDFITQYGSANIPNESTALSLFGEKVSQNLTNAKAGFTYADGKNGIYLFFNTDAAAFAGSAFSNQTFVLVAGVTLIAFATATFFIIRAVNKKKKAKTNAEA